MIRLVGLRTVYQGWLDLLIATFASGGDEFDRHIVKMGRAAAVLPYDPERRTALVISQPRAPVALLGLPDMLEAIAGGLDGDEAEDCARRESLEEGGVQLGDLEHVGRFWTMPSASTEEIDYFLGRYGRADRIASGGGLAAEHENITVHELTLAELWRQHEVNEMLDIKLVTLLTALRLRHPQLFDGTSPSDSEPAL